MNKFIRYRAGYKYQLFEDYTEIIGIYPEADIETEYIILRKSGLLIIKEGYAWDGASGPTIDTRSSMRGSLKHDALYQLMRLKLLPEAWRRKTDEILRDTCIEDGMWRWRAALWFRAVEDVAEISAHPGHDEYPVITAP